jgi:hypothetical protein
MADTGSKKEIWLRLRQYHFEQLVPPHLWDHVRSVFHGSDASTSAFADKLSRKLGWNRSFALRAVAEYKKFVYLGVVSNFGVTPSKVIDQVWHEHLLFSRAYRDFCSDVLQCEFDHNPELVPFDEETGVFEAQYRATLDAYEKEFDRTPPADIWAIPKFKMSGVPAGNYQPRLKLQEHTSAVIYDDTPLFLMFTAADGDEEERKRAHSDSFEGVDFGDHTSGYSGSDSGATGDHHSVHGCGDSGSGSANVDTGCAGSDSGSSDAGGGGSSSCSSSSCSSSCGGGGDGS